MHAMNNLPNVKSAGAAGVIVDNKEKTTNEKLLDWAEWVKNKTDQGMTVEIEAIEKAVGQLTLLGYKNLNHVVVDFYISNRPIEKIAYAMNISEHQVDQYLRAARDRLRKSIPQWKLTINFNRRLEKGGKR